jgi:hypothetical protein
MFCSELELLGHVSQEPGAFAELLVLRGLSAVRRQMPGRGHTSHVDEL